MAALQHQILRLLVLLCVCLFGQIYKQHLRCVFKYLEYNDIDELTFDLLMTSPSSSMENNKNVRRRNGNNRPSFSTSLQQHRLEKQENQRDSKQQGTQSLLQLVKKNATNTTANTLKPIQTKSKEKTTANTIFENKASSSSSRSKKRVVMINNNLTESNIPVWGLNDTIKDYYGKPRKRQEKPIDNWEEQYENYQQQLQTRRKGIGQKKNKKKNWAVLLIGGARTYTYTRKRFLQHVVNADSSNSGRKMDVFTYTFYDSECIVDTRSMNKLEDDSTRYYVESSNSSGYKSDHKSVDYYTKIKLTRHRFHNQQIAFDMLDEYAKANNITYDYVILTRPDLLHSENVNLTMIENAIDERENEFLKELIALKKKNKNVEAKEAQLESSSNTKAISKKDMEALMSTQNDPIKKMNKYDHEKSPGMIQVESRTSSLTKFVETKEYLHLLRGVSPYALMTPTCCDFDGLCDRFVVSSYRGMAHMIKNTKTWEEIDKWSIWEQSFKERAYVLGMNVFDFTDDGLGTTDGIPYSFATLRMSDVKYTCDKENWFIREPSKFHSKKTMIERKRGESAEFWGDYICFKPYVDRTRGSATAYKYLEEHVGGNSTDCQLLNDMSAMATCDNKIFSTNHTNPTDNEQIIALKKSRTDNNVTTVNNIIKRKKLKELLPRLQPETIAENEPPWKNWGDNLVEHSRLSTAGRKKFEIKHWAAEYEKFRQQVETRERIDTTLTGKGQYAMTRTKNWAVLLIGGARTYTYTRKRFLRHVVNADPNRKMDVFTYTFYDSNCNVDSMSMSNLEDDSTMFFVESSNSSGYKSDASGIDVFKKIGLTRNRFYNQEVALGMLDNYATKQNKTYDYVILTRPDLLHSQDLNLTLIENAIDQREIVGLKDVLAFNRDPELRKKKIRSAQLRDVEGRTTTLTKFTESGEVLNLERGVSPFALMTPTCCDHGGLCDRFAISSYRGMAHMIRNTRGWADLDRSSMWEDSFKERAHVLGMNVFDFTDSFDKFDGVHLRPYSFATLRIKEVKYTCNDENFSTNEIFDREDDSGLKTTKEVVEVNKDKSNEFWGDYVCFKPWLELYTKGLHRTYSSAYKILDDITGGNNRKCEMLSNVSTTCDSQVFK